MLIETLKTEGLGRLGKIIKPDFETPGILSIQSCLDFQEQYYIQNQTQTIPSAQDSKSTSDKELLNPNPICKFYPSLQMQNKTLTEIKSLRDFFPSKVFTIGNISDFFHVIPWDLPSLFLDQGKTYLEKLNELISLNDENEINYFINIPLEIARTFQFKISERFSGVILGDISSLLNHPKFLLDYIVKVRMITSRNTLLYAPAIPPSYFPFLTYLGIDLFDTLYMDLFNSSSKHDSLPILETSISSDTFTNILSLIKSSIKSGKLRDLVRIYANSFPPLKTMLRISDSTFSVEVGTPIYTGNTLYCTDETDFTRPEVSRFRQRVKNRYYPKKDLTGLIFLPCSARKPYSHSKSHSAFLSVIRRTLKKGRYSIGEIILTSPLGVVPRELEYTFPAGHYDIPVTGRWSDLEKFHLREDIESLLLKIPSTIPLVGFVKGAEREALDQVCTLLHRTVFFPEKQDIPLTAKESLKTFSELLRMAFNDLPVNGSKRMELINFIRTISDFQFGKGTGVLLVPDDVQIYGRKELGLKISLDKTHLLTFKPDNGLLTLSLQAGRRILGHTKNVVTFNGEKISGSTVFCNAIDSANHEIRAKDEVLVINREGDLLGVGTSLLPGSLLENMKRGKGVLLRKKVK
ncbi:MAG: DUF5591 domain-containing protein [Candidatus Hodarchaeales archaeon]